MKKIIATAALLASMFAYSENIDGTLAVDSYNSNGFEPDPQPQLSAGIQESEDAKGQESAYSPPVGTSSTYFMEGPFVGIELNPTFSAEAEGLSSSGLGFGIRFGAQNVEWRTMAILEKFGSSDDYNDYLRGLLQLDYFFLGMENLMIDTYAFRPYFGLSIGGISMDTQTENVKTLTYGGQVGATMNLTTNIDLDIGYRYNLATSDEIDHIHGASIGLNYKY
ncbi:MAG: outer membrane beta-barrel protein [Epsilonproteobacteria bacterium]|nr:outer membrane beta-barrel protein [Campylobacterota bacterium]